MSTAQVSSRTLTARASHTTIPFFQVLERLEQFPDGIFIVLLEEVFVLRRGERRSQFRDEVAARPTERLNGGGDGTGVQEDLDGVGHLRLDAQVYLDEEQLDKCVGQRFPVFLERLEDAAAYHQRIVVDQCY